MKKIAFTLALVAAMSICSATATLGGEERERFHFRTINFPNDTFTQLLGINDEEMIAGYHGAATNVGFVFSSRNNFTLENFPNSAQTQVIGINNRGYTDGFYIDAAGINHGFLDINGTFTTVDFPGTKLNQLLGLNNLEQAAGYYADAAGIDHPYIFDNKGGVFSVITIPAAAGGAQATGINDKGSISGFYIDGTGKNHGFLISKGEFRTLDFPAATLTQAFGLNNHDEVVGQYVDASGLTHGFIFDDGEYTSVDDPNGVGTMDSSDLGDGDTPRANGGKPKACPVLEVRTGHHHPERYDSRLVRIMRVHHQLKIFRAIRYALRLAR